MRGPLGQGGVSGVRHLQRERLQLEIQVQPHLAEIPLYSLANELGINTMNENH